MTQRIVVAGASGLIGSALVRALEARGAEVHTLVRGEAAGPREHGWSPGEGELDAEVLRGASSVISLGGANVGRLPWTARYRAELRSSRLDATRTIARAIRQLGDDAPSAWLSASASGFYGSQPGQVLDEASPAGETFLARLCVDWEAAALSVTNLTRVALLRTSPIIERDGVLKPMIALTRLGLGGPLGGGGQTWPWISLDDEVRGILHVLDTGLTGPVNLCGPAPATANDIGRALARELHRPFGVPAPAFALRAALGQDAADSLLLCDADVRPVELQRTGFEFTHPTAEEAVRAALRA